MHNRSLRVRKEDLETRKSKHKKGQASVDGNNDILKSLPVLSEPSQSKTSHEVLQDMQEGPLAVMSHVSVHSLNEAVGDAGRKGGEGKGKDEMKREDSVRAVGGAEAGMKREGSFRSLNSAMGIKREDSLRGIGGEAGLKREGSMRGLSEKAHPEGTGLTREASLREIPGMKRENSFRGIHEASGLKREASVKAIQGAIRGEPGLDREPSSRDISNLIPEPKPAKKKDRRILRSASMPTSSNLRHNHTHIASSSRNDRGSVFSDPNVRPTLSVGGPSPRRHVRSMTMGDDQMSHLDYITTASTQMGSWIRRRSSRLSEIITGMGRKDNANRDIIAVVGRVNT
ncbi:hypothetical protein HDU97_000898 [Phlyctochytrium planicorne]|nr:hypothetical protein HDU97_000886 [Phlyctochytrium planicorne]KAJ3102055.1 hypothetical protein HDU97_000898 [Phlyctochytrium planicorne]